METQINIPENLKEQVELAEFNDFLFHNYYRSKISKGYWFCPYPLRAIPEKATLEEIYIYWYNNERGVE